MDDRLELPETQKELTGESAEADGRVENDPVADRIEALIDQVLEPVAEANEGWDTLFLDPRDGRYWERTYPFSDRHGGGPPRLRVLSADEARAKYDLGAGS